MQKIVFQDATVVKAPYVDINGVEHPVIFETEGGTDLDAETFNNMQDNIENAIIDDYEDLSNKPQINSVELIGNKSLDDLGIASKNELTNLKKTTYQEKVVGSLEYKVTKNNVEHIFEIPIYRQRIDTVFPTNEIIMTGVKEIHNENLSVYSIYDQWWDVSSSGVASDNYRTSLFLTASGNVTLIGGSFFTKGTSPVRGWLEYTKISDYNEAYNNL